MSYHVLTPPSRSGVPVLTAAAAVLVFAAAVALAWGFARPISVTVDGHRATVRAGLSVGDLRHGGVVRARAGALRAINGSVIALDGGNPPLVTRNGRPVALSRRVFDGDVITSRSGSDRLERAATLRVPIPFKRRVEGSGPVMHLADPGSVGVREMTRGEVSGVEMAGYVTRPAVDMVVMRSRPAPTDKLIALTFDDGPWVIQTDRILGILKNEGIHASFFMLGERAKNHPDIARRVAEGGHTIGNHTYDHRLLTVASPAVMYREIAYGLSSIRSASGVKPAWFRPPYGSIDTTVWAQTRALNMRVALWDVDSRDWSKPGVARIVANAETNVRAGSIILMHDGGGTRDQTIAALPIIIRDLKARGFVFVTLDQLASAR